MLDPDPYRFFLDPDPYQSSPWIRIRNKFFHILDQDPDPYQNDTDPQHCLRFSKREDSLGPIQRSKCCTRIPTGSTKLPVGYPYHALNRSRIHKICLFFRKQPTEDGSKHIMFSRSGKDCAAPFGLLSFLAFNFTPPPPPTSPDTEQLN